MVIVPCSFFFFFWLVLRLPGLQIVNGFILENCFLHYLKFTLKISIKPMIENKMEAKLISLK